MTGLMRSALALGAALMMSLSPVLAKESLGIYQTSDRKMDFELTACGSGGKDLCVRLLAARGGAKTPQVKPYIGKLVVNKAKPAGTNNWRGVMKFRNYELNGQMKLRPGQDFTIAGCIYLVVCEDIRLIPAK